MLVKEEANRAKESLMVVVTKSIKNIFEDRVG